MAFNVTSNTRLKLQPTRNDLFHHEYAQESKVQITVECVLKALFIPIISFSLASADGLVC